MSSTSIEDKRVQVKIEVGHQSICRDNKTSSGYTHDWTIFVRGAEGANISHFVEKVVFLLHESFPKPKRVLKEPPYEVTESGYGSFTLPVEIYFRNSKEEPRKYKLEYDLSLQLVGMPPLNVTKVEALTFLNPSDEFEKKLLKGGAIVLPNAASPNTAVQNSDCAKVSPTSPNTSSHCSSPGHSKKSHPNKFKVKDHSQASSSQAVKRSILSNDDITHKSKKKKSEKVETIQSQKPVKEISVLSPAGPESDSSKAKTIITTKKIKERKVSTDISLENTENLTSVKENSQLKKPAKESRSKGKEIKVKKEKDKKNISSPENINDKEEQPKLQKFTIKRLADDAWSSTTSPVVTNHNNNIITDLNISKNTFLSNDNSIATTPVNNNNEAVLNDSLSANFKKKERVNVIFKEFAKDPSSDEDENDISKTERKSDIEDNAKKIIEKVKIEMDASKEEKPTIKNNTSNLKDSLKSKPIESKTRKSKVHQNSSLINDNTNKTSNTSTIRGEIYDNVKIEETVAEPVTNGTSVLSPLPNNHIHNHISNNNNIKKKNNEEPTIKITMSTTMHKSNSELLDIYNKLNTIEDNDTLQKIVDLVEETGTFEITSSTFDFDLCVLEKSTIDGIKNYLKIS